MEICDRRSCGVIAVVELEPMACPKCGMMFALERGFVDRLRRKETGGAVNEDRSDYVPGEVVCCLCGQPGVERETEPGT